MGIDKFLHLITKKKLFFCRLSKLTDKFEGSLPKDTFSNRLRQLSKIKGIDAPKKSLKERKELELFKYYTFLNCWTINREESYALWKIYLRGSTCGIAIRSTISRLRKSIEPINKEIDFYLGKVNYTNYIKDYPPTWLLLTTTKKLYYEFENELRVFYKYDEAIEKEDQILSHVPGYYVDININELIESIYISPFTSEWFKESLIEIFKKNQPNLTNLIKLSGIQDQ